MLARQFPPIGGAGVHRSVGYVRYLPDHGFRPVVVTGGGRGVDRFAPSDPALLERIPAGTEVHRVSASEPAARGTWSRRLDRWFSRSQPFAREWVERAVEIGSAVGRDCDLILASCIPYETAEAGARLASILDKPWVADLEDPWALDEMRVQPTRLHQRRDLARMRSALASAAAIVTCAPEAAERMRRALPAPGRVVEAVPIGFEPEQFRRDAPAPTDDGILRIVHTGSMHTELGLAHRRSARLRRLLGGTSVDVDILTRSPVFLVEAVKRLLREEPAAAGRIELHLAGDLTPGDRQALHGLAFVRLHGQLPHDQTVALMRSAGLLFLPMHELPPGRRAGLIPYKTYEYLAAGRPILAAVPDGDVRDMLGSLERVTLCRPSDVGAMARALREHLRVGERPPETASGDIAGLSELGRDRLASRLAALLEAALEPERGTAARPSAEVVPPRARLRAG